MADNKVYTTTSVLYDALDLGTSGTWSNDGELTLTRPPISSKLKRIKFRSFSASLKNAIQNVLAPSLTCDLCANVEILNSTSTAPSAIGSKDELENMQKLLTNGNVQNQYTLNILNQTGLKSYNNIYENVIKLATYNIPLNNSVEYSIGIGLQRARIELMKILGLIADESNDKDNFDYLSFQYGTYRLPFTTNSWASNSLNSVVGALWLSPTTLNHFGFKAFSNLNFYNAQQSNSIGMVGSKLINVYGNSVNHYGTKILGLCSSTTSSYYSLPTEVGYIDYDGYDYVQEFLLSGSSRYEQFYASATNGMVISTSNGQPNGINDQLLFVAMATTDVLNKPNYMCLPVVRWQMNQDEVKMFSYSSYDGMLYDRTTYFTDAMNACIARNVPLTANLVKVDNFAYYPNYQIVSAMIFAKFDSSEITFYIYAFTSTEAQSAGWVPNYNNCLYTTHTFTGDFYDVMTNDNQQVWNNYIDTLFGSAGILSINLPGNPGMFVFTPTQGFVWCSARDYFPSVTDTNALYNMTSYTCQAPFNGEQVWMNTFAITVNYKDANDYYQSQSLYWTWQNDPNTQTTLANITNPNTGTPIIESQYFNTFDSYVDNQDNPSRNPAYVCPAYNNGYLYFYAYIPSANEGIIVASLVRDPPSNIRYTLTNSMLSVNCWNGTFLPYLPTINGTGGPNYNWCKGSHITPETPQGYQYLYYNANTEQGGTYSEFIDSIFKWDQTNNTITFPNVPIYCTQDGTTTYGNILFYIAFSTSPEVITFTPNIKQGIRSSCAPYYSTYKQLINKEPSLYLQSYTFDKYFVILDDSYYTLIQTYLTLRQTDMTLKLVCNIYPTINNIVFYLNETSMIDFKETEASPNEPNIKCQILDATGAILTPSNASLIYSNITICVDWEYYT